MLTPRSLNIALRVAGSIAAVRILKRRIPLYCEWEVTSRCNMQCDDCSTWIPGRNRAAETTPAQALDTVDQLAGLGTRMLHLSGGEPTIRADLPDLIARARMRGIIVSLTTNGSGGDKALQGIALADIVRVSIDGPEEFHDRVRHAPGAYRSAIRCLRFLRTHGRRPQITTIYRPGTPYESVAGLAETARELGVQLALNVMGRNVNDNAGESVPEGVRAFDDPRFGEYLAVCERLRADYGTTLANPSPIPQIIRAGGLDRFGCRALDIAISIKADGNVSLPCTGLTQSRIAGPLRDAYYGEEAARLRPQQGKLPMCRGCYIKCMCSASALLTFRGPGAIADSYVRSL